MDEYTHHQAVSLATTVTAIKTYLLESFFRTGDPALLAAVRAPVDLVKLGGAQMLVRLGLPEKLSGRFGPAMDKGGKVFVYLRSQDPILSGFVHKGDYLVTEASSAAELAQVFHHHHAKFSEATENKLKEILSKQATAEAS